MLTTVSKQAKGLELSLYLAPATEPEVRRLGTEERHEPPPWEYASYALPLSFALECSHLNISCLRPLVPPVDSGLLIICSGQGRGQVSPLWSALEFVPGFTHNR